MKKSFFSWCSLFSIRNKKITRHFFYVLAFSASTLGSFSANASERTGQDLTVQDQISQNKALDNFLANNNYFDTANVKKIMGDNKKTPSLTNKQMLIAEHINSKYANVDLKTATKIVKESYIKAKKYNIDPEMLLAIAGVESNYNPRIVNRLGASGLTQVVKRYHRDKIRKINEDGGSILDIADNLDLGAEIYSDLYKKYGNHIAALQAYNGSLNDKSRRYSKKVMRELSEIRSSQ